MLLKKTLFFISIILIFFISCTSDVDINIPEGEEPITANFRVDFDGETWIADTISATVIGGVTTMTAFRNDNQERVIITLFADQVGSYILSPVPFVGGITYQNDLDVLGAFVSNPSALSGRIELDIKDEVGQLLTGRFFYTGTRSVQQFDTNGDPVLDGNGDPVYITESKDFTNGVFENIFYTTAVIDPDPTGDNFFAKINNFEFVEESLTAVKTTILGVSRITIVANRNGITEAITLSMPADIIINNYPLISVPLDLTVDVAASYANGTTAQFFGAANGVDPDDVNTARLSISNHNITDKLIEGTFEFTGFESGGSDKVQVTEGSFSVTYIE